MRESIYINWSICIYNEPVENMISCVEIVPPGVSILFCSFDKVACEKSIYTFRRVLEVN